MKLSHTQARMQALAASGRKEWFQIQAAADGGNVAKVYVYDRIGFSWFFGGVSAKDMVDQLDEITAGEIHVHINSPGGDVYDGIAIMNALRHHDAKVVAYIDGLAASAASVVAMGADEVVMSTGAEMMVHDAWSIALGDAAEMRAAAEDLDRISNNLAKLYARKAGGTTQQWRDVMVAETWYSDSEAVAAGLADRVDDATEDADDAPAVAAAWDLSVFAHAGRDHAPKPAMPANAFAAGGPLPLGSIQVRNRTGRPERIHKPSSASAAEYTPPNAPAPGDTSQKGSAVAFTDQQMTTMRQSLGVPNDADEQTILAALDEALQERAGDEPSNTINITNQVPEGMALVDEATLASLRDDAVAGREARDQQQTERRQNLVSTAVREGRIPPARRQHWEAQLAADPGAEAVLASLSAGLVPMDEIGHGDPAGPQSADMADETYNTLFPGSGSQQKEG